MDEKIVTFSDSGSSLRNCKKLVDEVRMLKSAFVYVPKYKIYSVKKIYDD